MIFPTLAYWLKETDVKEIKKAMKILRERLAALLPDIDAMTNAQLAAVLLAYEKVIARHFLHWMMLSWLRTSTKKARKVGCANLLCEVREDHPRMLVNFVWPLYENPEYGIAERSARKAEQSLVTTIDEILGSCYTTSHGGLFVMALLENLSLVFIPWMKKAADRLGLKKQKYLKVHGVADIKHAEAYCRAVIVEYGDRTPLTADQYLAREEVTMIMLLLGRVFTAHKIDDALNAPTP